MVLLAGLQRQFGDVRVEWGRKKEIKSERKAESRAEGKKG